MAIVYDCACRYTITAGDDSAGKIQKCPACRMSGKVPDAPEVDPPKGRNARPGR